MARTIQQISFPAPMRPSLKRVAAYARVSSGKDAMLHSLSAQVSYYSALIQKHAGWLYCGVYADETISSRSHRAYVSGKRKWTRNLFNTMFFWQDDHCKEAYESEMERTQLPPEMREAQH